MIQSMLAGHRTLLIVPHAVVAMAMILFGSNGLYGDVAHPGDVPVGVTECMAGPEYYEIDLVSTRKLPGTYGAAGVVEVQFSRSPFGVALTGEGEYVYDVHFQVDNIRAPKTGQYVAWIATPNLDQVIHVGALGEDAAVSGQVSFNKFLVIVSLEQDQYDSSRWAGPIALRGLSRSGMMHTSIGHGLFEDEPCAQYGFN